MEIIKAEITPMPKSFVDPMPKVIATFEDGTKEELFSFYPDEITFTENEFIGLTAKEAHQFKMLKDKAYLAGR